MYVNESKERAFRESIPLTQPFAENFRHPWPEHSLRTAKHSPFRSEHRTDRPVQPPRTYRTASRARRGDSSIATVCLSNVPVPPAAPGRYAASARADPYRNTCATERRGGPCARERTHCARSLAPFRHEHRSGTGPAAEKHGTPSHEPKPGVWPRPPGNPRTLRKRPGRSRRAPPRGRQAVSVRPRAFGAKRPVQHCSVLLSTIQRHPAPFSITPRRSALLRAAPCCSTLLRDAQRPGPRLGLTPPRERTARAPPRPRWRGQC